MRGVTDPFAMVMVGVWRLRVVELFDGLMVPYDDACISLAWNLCTSMFFWTSGFILMLCNSYI